MATMKDVTVETGITATGSALADAYQLNAATNAVATAAASTGVKLPPNAAKGAEVFVVNQGANALNVYPATSAGTINGGAAGAALSLAVTNYGLRSRKFVCLGSDTWVTVGTVATA